MFLTEKVMPEAWSSFLSRDDPSDMSRHRQGPRGPALPRQLGLLVQERQPGLGHWGVMVWRSWCQRCCYLLGDSLEAQSWSKIFGDWVTMAVTCCDYPPKKKSLRLPNFLGTPTKHDHSQWFCWRSLDRTSWMHFELQNFRARSWTKHISTCSRYFHIWSPGFPIVSPLFHYVLPTFSQIFLGFPMVLPLFHYVLPRFPRFS